MPLAIRLTSLSSTVTVDEIEKIFSEIGQVTSVSMPIERYAIVEMASDELVEKAEASLRGAKLGGETFTFSKFQKKIKIDPEVIQKNNEAANRTLDKIFQFTENWAVTSDSVGPLKFGMPLHEVSKIIGPLKEQVVADQYNSEWPQYFYQDKRVEEIQSLLKQHDWNKVDDSFSYDPGITFVFHPQEGLAAIKFEFSQYNPTWNGYPLLGSTAEDAKRHGIDLSEIPFQKMKPGIGVPGTWFEDQRRTSILVYSKVYKDEFIWTPFESPKKSFKIALKDLFESELQDLVLKSVPMKKWKAPTTSNLKQPLVIAFDIEDDDEDYLIAEIDLSRITELIGFPKVPKNLQIWGTGNFESSHEDSCFLKWSESGLQKNGVLNLTIDEAKVPKMEKPHYDPSNEYLRLRIWSTIRKKYALEDCKHIISWFQKTEKNTIDPKAKLGGWPDWIQNDDTPICSKCAGKVPMKLLIQLPTTGAMHFGNHSTVYIFGCEKHPEELKLVEQST